VTRAELRRYAVTRSLAPSMSLMSAIRRLGYLQADPIRAPARAQDLILRHRVPGYRIDELEKQYPQLPLIEDMLHNYGFFPDDHIALLYPRAPSSQWREFVAQHPALRRKLLRYLAENEEAHPRDVERHLGDGARINGWGGRSSASTLMLDALHREGRARVSRRDSGIRIYAAAPPRPRALPAAVRADGLIRMVVNLYAPLPLRTLTQLINMMGSRKPELDYPARIALLVRRGELCCEEVDRMEYVWPAGETIGEGVEIDVPNKVRFLAPFDPVVWDRRRFEHLWGWQYRFEAYLPPARRKLGYYALPMLWRENVIGWANASLKYGKLKVETGFALKKPSRGDATAFRRALEAEVEDLRSFLKAPSRATC